MRVAQKKTKTKKKTKKKQGDQYEKKSYWFVLAVGVLLIEITTLLSFGVAAALLMLPTGRSRSTFYKLSTSTET